MSRKNKCSLPPTFFETRSQVAQAASPCIRQVGALYSGLLRQSQHTAHSIRNPQEIKYLGENVYHCTRTGASSVQLCVTIQEALGAILLPHKRRHGSHTCHPRTCKVETGKFKVSLGYILSLGPA